ncbi:MAG TPA: tetratricopeptide repeat protein [Bryobacteraceae bacterium]|nr:tetratricopeptide repeat protein [Bryobacteraceae bacterium]
MKAAKLKTAAQTPATGASTGWVWFVAAAAVLFLVWEAYWPAIHGPFVFDDEYLPFHDDRFLTSLPRFVMNLSFFLNRRLFGLEPFSYHLFNLIFHTINGGLMFLALRKLLAIAGWERSAAKLLAAFSAALFLLHPALTESVAYVSARSESLSLMFFLSSFTLFLYQREGGIAWPGALGVIALFGAAVLTKEHAAVLPGLLLWTDWYFADGRPVETIRRNWRVYLPMLGMGAAGLGFVWRILGQASTAGFGMKDLPWHDYLFTQWRALWVYLRLFVVPAGLNADYEFPISRSPLDHGALFGLMGLIALLGASFYYRRKFPLVFYGLVVFFLLIAPTSSFVPIKDPVAERRLYLPFLGLLAALCDLLRHVRASQGWKVGGMAAVLLLLTGLTYARSTVWGDPIRLWEDTAQKSPGNYRAHFQLAMAYYQSQRCQEAVKKFEDAARVSKPEHTLLVDWGLAYVCLNQHDQALSKLREAATLQNTAHVRAHIGMVLARQNKLGAALDELNEAVKLDAGYDMSYLFRGKVFLLLNEYEKAELDLRKALALNPNNEPAQQDLASLERRRGSRP